MFTYSATIEISADSDKVWETIVEMDHYPQWNSQIRFLGGKLALGGQIHLRLDPLGAKGYDFKATITRYEPGKHLTWLGTTGIKGVFDGEHHFKLERISASKTRLSNYEHFSGILAPIFRRLPMMKKAEEGFELMNQEIKQRSEN